MALLTYDLVDGPLVVTELVEVGAAATVKAASVTSHYGEVLLAAVRRNANSAQHKPGEPHVGGYQGEGPNKVTGEYIDSWRKEDGFGEFGPESTVGTDAPQALRLELGFVSEDSLGRHYHQLPLPHAGPAFDEVSPRYEAAIYELVLP